jgi:hypothetical protein
MTDADGADWPPDVPVWGPSYDDVPDDVQVGLDRHFGPMRSRRRRRPEPSREELLQAQIDEAANIAARARLELERIGARPKEPEGENAIIRFQYQFHRGGRVYNYAAVKAGGLWYTTGPQSPKGYTWQELSDWLAESTLEPFVCVAKKFARLDGHYSSGR